MDKIIVVGCSGHAKVVLDVFEQAGQYEVVGLLDSFKPVGERLGSYHVLGHDADLLRLCEAHGLKGIFVAIGDNYMRGQLLNRLCEVCPQLKPVSAIHPRAVVASSADIAGGVVIMAGATVNPDAKVGLGVKINTGASLDHDSVMAPFSSLAPQACTGGNCVIGEYAAVSIGATLIHGVQVGEHAVIGAGATVLKDIEPYEVAYGTPAKAVRKRTIGERYL